MEQKTCRSLNAIVAQPRIAHVDLLLTAEPQNITTSPLVSWNVPR